MPLTHISKPIENTLLRIVAARVVADLETLDNQLGAIDSINHSYRELKIAVVMKTLKELQEAGDATDA